MSKLKEMTGLRFGRLTVIEYAGSIWRGGRHRAHWKVRCDCGNEKEIDGGSLRNGWTRSCGCLRVEAHSGEGNPRYSGGRIKAEYTRQKTLAERSRGLSFTLTFSEVERLFSYPCFYCGAAPVKTGRRGLVRNGIDRVDNDVGYEVDNVVACCWTCNSMKSSLGFDEFILHIKRIVTHVSA